LKIDPKKHIHYTEKDAPPMAQRIIILNNHNGIMPPFWGEASLQPRYARHREEVGLLKTA
jgi:hypothetical protein